MKKLNYFALLWIALFAGSLAWCSNDVDVNNPDASDIIIEDSLIDNDPVVEYNDNLVDFAYSYIASESNIWDRFDSEDSSLESIQSAIDDTISECTSAIENISALWDWEWDSSLKDAAILTLEKDIAYFSKLSELLPYTEKEDLTDEENDAYERIFNEIEALDAELLEANENLAAVQEVFAENHWFELDDGDSLED